MNKNITSLKPELLWKHFAAICAIPHPSAHEQGVLEYIIEFAKQNNIEWREEGGNVILRKAATPGMEGCKGVVLQAHMDMVPQKNNDKEFDFLKDGIEAYIDGEWVTANGTTLGADNGIGMAAALAVMESSDIEHGPIEALFTYSEETGMFGAFSLSSGLLNGDILLNTDSETEGELYVGCAGGMDANITLPYVQQPVPVDAEYCGYEIAVKGLRGGHSGIDIIFSRGNANKILARALRAASKSSGALLSAIDGGGLRNAIPREAVAVVVVEADKAERMIEAVAQVNDLVKKELEGVDNDVEINVTPTALPEVYIDTDTQLRLINAIYGCPNGVIRMSPSIEGLVQTSTNLARVVSNDGVISIQCLLRSSSRSEKEELGEAIRSVFVLAGATVELSGSYDGWTPNMNSPIMTTMKRVYNDLYGKEPAIMAIHAGLECGIFSGAYPHWDMISFGPTICNPHSPDEKVNIASVEKFWNFLTATLKQIPQK